MLGLCNRQLRTLSCRRIFPPQAATQKRQQKQQGSVRKTPVQQVAQAVSEQGRLFAQQERRFFSKRMTGIPSGKNDNDEDLYDGLGTPHFRRAETEHPILERTMPSMQRTESIQNKTKIAGSMLTQQGTTYDEHTWSLPAVNHLWTPQEIRHSIENQPKYEPKTIGDKTIRFLVKDFLYRGFNYFSGFDYTDPTPRSCAFRLIMLESIAGIPGMVAGVVRHFDSLRTLRRDNGWIHTLFEEAQNERMHLMVCLKMFDAGLLTRIGVVGAQFVIVPFMFGLYIVHPRSLHRFVGYLEETAVKTYTDLVRITRTPGTRLNKSWGNVPASDLAKAYWNMDDESMWVDVLEQLLADESHHRDVNHAFADMQHDEPNPFIAKKMDDLQMMGERETMFSDIVKKGSKK